ncbi:MAG: hypothetical protein JSR48_12510 [Verrucomicrobia bacterium]|nr:hypothetical protein [Verrucomicrobiota bacterium]
MHTLVYRLGPVGLGLVTLLLGGCESGPDRRAMEEARKSVPPMAANDTFFDGRIVARITLGDTLVGGSRGGPGGRGGPGARGAGGHFGGGRHRGGGGEAAEGGGGGELYDPESSSELRARYVDSPMPPAMLRLHLENASKETVTVEVTEFDSDLGNFATQPDKFTLEPGGVGEPNGMQSLLGVDSLALPIKVTLRVAGKSETKTMILRPVTPPPETPKPPAG